MPFIRLGVENDFPQEHSWLEIKEKQPCVLNVFEREDFVRYRTSLKKVEGAREDYLPQLLLADESEVAVREYLDDGELYEIKCGEQLAGVALLLEQSDSTVELKILRLYRSIKVKDLGKKHFDK